MSFLQNVLRVYSWIFLAILCLISIGVNIVSGREALKLPWTTPHLTYWMVGLAVLGLFFVVLAMMGKMRILLFLFSIYVVYLLVTGFFLNLGYVFAGPADAEKTGLLVIGAIFAMIGAWPIVKNRSIRLRAAGARPDF